MLAYCGLECFACPAYVATQENDPQKKAAVARLWSEAFKASISAESIVCDGCKSTTGRLFYHCSTCEIRRCAVEKQIETCGFCLNFPCGKLDFIFSYDPDAKKRLEGRTKCT